LENTTLFYLFCKKKRHIFNNLNQSLATHDLSLRAINPIRLAAVILYHPMLADLSGSPLLPPILIVLKIFLAGRVGGEVCLNLVGEFFKKSFIFC
jgi:hypothetical protein